MIDGLYLSANVYDCDGILATSFVGDYATLQKIFETSVDDKHCPPYYQERVMRGFVKIVDMQMIVRDSLDTSYFNTGVPSYSIPFMCFISGLAVDDSGTLSEQQLRETGEFLSEIDSANDYIAECYKNA